MRSVPASWQKAPRQLTRHDPRLRKHLLRRNRRVAAPARALLSGRGGSAIWAPLLAKLDSKEIDPSFVIAHRVSLEEAPAAYATFRDKKEGCVEVVLRP